MAILVTGGAGYIGSHMAYALADAGERVIVLDNLSTGFRWAIPKDVLFVVGESGDQTLVEALIAQHNIEAIVHFAASLLVGESMSDPLSYYRNNTVNSRALIETAIKGGVRNFVFSSTAAVYGNPVKAPTGEDDPIQPMSPYGHSKFMTEVMLRDAARAYGLHYVVLRYFNVAGADPQLRTGESTIDSTHLIKIAAETAFGARAKMQIFGTDYPTADGTCIRDYIHVTDLARAHSDALAHLRRGGASETLNCGYGHGFSVLEVINTVKQIAKRDFTVEMGARRPGDPAQIVAASDRIRSVLGWRPRFDDLATIVGHALSWEHKLLAQRNRWDAQGAPCASADFT
jgi:UDP-glucose 4-epimerase